MKLSLTDNSYQEAVARTNRRIFRDTGTILYQRFVGSWQRRVSHTVYTDHWKETKRLPRAVREIGKQMSTTTKLQIEYDTKTKTAKARPWWTTI